MKPSVKVIALPCRTDEGPRPPVRANLRYSLQDAVACALMVGLGETYLPAFVMAIGLGEINAGLIVTLPLMVGALLQLMSPTMVRYLNSYRRWVVIGAVLQASTFLLLTAAAFAGYLPAPAAFLIAALYWGMGMTGGAAWNCWIGGLIPPPIRTRFFAKRARLTQLGSLAGFLIGGFLLHDLVPGHPTWNFAFLFILAFLARLFSARALRNQSETSVPKTPPPRLMASLKDLLVQWQQGTQGSHLLIYMIALQFTVQLASPFFAPFMLGPLRMNYANYAFLYAISFVAKILAYPWFAHVARKYGVHTVLRLSGLGIILVPAAFMLPANLGSLGLAQALSGFAWAGNELAYVLILLSAFNESERIRFLITYNVANAIAQTVGSLVGASLLDGFGRDHRAYLILFGVSCVARLLTLAPLRKISATDVRWLPFFLSQISVNMRFGFLMQPVLAPLRALRSKTRKETNKPRKAA
jgi:MFS family permease